MDGRADQNSQLQGATVRHACPGSWATCFTAWCPQSIRGCGLADTVCSSAVDALGEGAAASGGILDASTCIRRSEILRAERTLEG